MPEPEILPFVVSMLTCDMAVTEQGTNKRTLVGIFDKVLTRAVPAALKPFWLYGKLTDFRGIHKLQFNVIHLESEKMIGTLDAEGKNFDETSGYFEFAIQMPPMELPFNGPYEIQLLSDGVYIGRTLITLIVQGDQA